MPQPMPNTRLDQPNGFTLIELLVVIGIILIVATGSIAGFLNFQSRRIVLSYAKEIQQMVRNAQAKARVRENPQVTGNPALCNSDTSRLQGYRVKFASSTSISLYPICGLDADIGATSYNLTEADLLSTITLSGVSLVGSFPTNLDYYTLHRPNYPASYTVQVTGSGYNYCFNIEGGGVVTDVISC